jgi:plasmid maintenance system antidote protein VapI
MEKVKKLIEAGARIPTAIKESLPVTLGAFADQHGLNEKAVSNAINGNVRPSDDLIAAFVRELGGTEAEWRELLWLAAKPDAVAS